MDRIENVVFVIVDALRADRVGAVGGTTGLTPHIDDIAATGTAFENAFTCASNTDPSVTSILTGRYPSRTVYHHGKLVTDEEKRRVESVTPLPETLSDSGLRTVATGQSLRRWHPRGFDHYPGTDTEATGVDPMTVARRVFDVVNSVSPRTGSMLRSLYGFSNRDVVHNVVTEDHEATALLSHVDSGPFFGQVHLMDTHMPYLGITDDFETLLATRDYPDVSLEAYAAQHSLTDAQYERLQNAISSLDLAGSGELVALYDAAVRHADRKAGHLVESLQDAGLWESTALFVTSDHGESLLDHGIYVDHHGLYDDVFRVPLVTNLGTGDQIQEFVQLIDLAPTAFDILDVEAPPTDGQSLLPLVTDREGRTNRGAVFAEEAYTERRIGVRTEKWKYIRHVEDDVLVDERGSSLECGYCKTIHGDPPELFDLEGDPAETENVVEEHPEVVSDLEERYESFLSNLADVGSPKREPVGYDHEDELLDRLEAIGYK